MRHSFLVSFDSGLEDSLELANIVRRRIAIHGAEVIPRPPELVVNLLSESEEFAIQNCINTPDGEISEIHYTRLERLYNQYLALVSERTPL